MTSPKIIKPTVGRKVWYRPSEFDLQGPGGMVCSNVDKPAAGQPLDATILAVFGERCVNVLVLDMMGKPFTKTLVTLRQPGDPSMHDLDGNPVGGYVEWMPYQAAQSLKESIELPVVDLSTRTASLGHDSEVLYPAIKRAMNLLGDIPEGESENVDRAWNELHHAYWSEAPAPASAAPLRDVNELDYPPK